MDHFGFIALLAGGIAGVVWPKLYWPSYRLVTSEAEALRWTRISGALLTVFAALLIANYW